MKQATIEKAMLKRKGQHDVYDLKQSVMTKTGEWFCGLSKGSFVMEWTLDSKDNISCLRIRRKGTNWGYLFTSVDKCFKVFDRLST